MLFSVYIGLCPVYSRFFFVHIGLFCLYMKIRCICHWMHKAKGVATMVFFADTGLFCVYIRLFCVFRALSGVVMVLLRVYKAWSCEPQNETKSCDPHNASKRKELPPGLVGVCIGLFCVYTGLFCVYRTLCFYMHTLFWLYVGLFRVYQKNHNDTRCIGVISCVGYCPTQKKTCWIPLGALRRRQCSAIHRLDRLDRFSNKKKSKD